MRYFKSLFLVVIISMLSYLPLNAETTVKELFFDNEISNQKILNEFLAEGHRRISSPFLVIFMSLAAACSILIGSSKHSNNTKRISLVSAVIVAIQAIFIIAINTINFSFANTVIFYLTLVLMIAFPIILIEYERKLLKSLNLL